MSSQKISRRSFLKTASMFGIGAGLMRGLPSFANAAFQDKLDMSLWWWADDPAYGKWVEDTAKKFSEKNPNITISTLQQDTCCVISQFTTAAAAGETPDVQFFFNGIYHIENVWQGYLEPLNDLIPEDIRKNSNASPLSVFDGKQYRLG